jgi:HSP20 family protein
MALIQRFTPFSASPFGEFSRMQNQLNRLLSSLAPAQEESMSDWAPEVDIYEDEKGIQVRADIPGIDPKDVKVNVENGMLTVSGERTQEKEEKKENYHRMERSYGSFCRTFSLPDYADADKIEASYKNGVLHVSVPKKAGVESKQGKQIEVRAG